MNIVELNENPQLHVRVVHDLNSDPMLPLETERFDAAMVTVSIQYITQPIEVFREVRRVLKPGGAFHVVFSDRMFPTKAVAVWQAMPDPERRAELIAAYFAESGGWGVPQLPRPEPRRRRPERRPSIRRPRGQAHAARLTLGSKGLPNGLRKGTEAASEGKASLSSR